MEDRFKINIAILRHFDLILRCLYIWEGKEFFKFKRYLILKGFQAAAAFTFHLRINNYLSYKPILRACEIYRCVKIPQRLILYINLF